MRQAPNSPPRRLLIVVSLLFFMGFMLPLVLLVPFGVLMGLVTPESLATNIVSPSIMAMGGLEFIIAVAIGPY